MWEEQPCTLHKFITGQAHNILYLHMHNLESNNLRICGLWEEARTFGENPCNSTGTIVQAPHGEIQVGIEPRTFLLWGDSASYNITMIAK